LVMVMLGCGSPSGGPGDDASALTDVPGGDVVAVKDVSTADAFHLDTLTMDVRNDRDASEAPDAPGLDDMSPQNDTPTEPDGTTLTDIQNDASTGDDASRRDGGDVPPGDVAAFICPAGLQEIVLPGTVTPIMGTTSGMSTLRSSRCTTSADGPEHFYTLRVTEPTNVVLDTVNRATTLNTTLSVRRCDTGEEIACNDNAVAGSGGASLLRTHLEPGTYTIIVDSGYSTSGGPYVLSARSYTAAPNGSCTGALALAPGETLAMQDLGLAASLSTACSRWDSWPLYYNLVVPPFSFVRVTATPTMGESWTPSMRVLPTCSSATCEALGTSGTVVVRNGTGAPRTLRLLVSSLNDGPWGTFSLSMSAASPLAPNATCENATPIAPGTTLTGQDLRLAFAANTACGESSLDNYALHYSVTVPPNSRVTVTAATTPWMGATGATTVRVLDACGDTTCVARGGGQNSTTVLSNAGTTARTFRVVVSPSLAPAVLFTVAASAPSPIAANAFCAGALSLPPSGLANQELAGAVARQICSGGPGEHLFYTVTVGPRSATTVVARPTGTSPTLRPSMVLSERCDPASCIDSASTLSEGGSVPMLVVNGSDTEREFRLSVGSSQSVVGGTFDLESSSRTLVPSAACELPGILLLDASAISGDTSLGLRRARICTTPHDMGNEVFYRLDLPALSRVTLRASPTGGGRWRPRIRVRARPTCNARCLAEATTSVDGGEAVLNVDNPTLLSWTVLVSVSSTTTATGGTFSLAGASSPLATQSPYVLATISAACEDVSAGTRVAPLEGGGGWPSSSATEIAAMPFTFRFFGTDVTHYSVSSSGIAQLWTSLSGRPSSGRQETIPNSGEPNNLIAPFWASGFYSRAGVSSVRAQALGVAPLRRFIIEWRDWSNYNGADRLTFQAKIFEGTGVMEFHYCSMTPTSDFATGGSAIVGAEDALGRSAALISIDTPNRTATDTAYRLTPR
jgi:hypothetical protein